MLLALCGTALIAAAQGSQPARAVQAGAARAHQATDHTVPALLISDIHFDPFHDPAKVKQLVAAPAGEWGAILAASPSPNQEEAFEALQRNCYARRSDTPFALLQSALQAMRSTQSNAKIMTVSGDLIAHGFLCRYRKLVPGSTAADYQEFVLKTMEFVLGELRTAFPQTPVYVALGNNDTACDDYRLDAESEFLTQAGKIVAKGLPLAQQQEVLNQFGTGGYYSVTMSAPMQGTRLIVLNDLVLSPKYRNCAGKPDTTAAAVEMEWLEHQLENARQAGQRVWVMGHIPPGIDPYSTLTGFKNVCAGEDPVMFLSQDRLAGLLVDYADVVRLGIFAHTHMDEMRVLESEGSEAQSPVHMNVAIKIVPSISPVGGNDPSFTVARVNPASAVLEDYQVFSASYQTGVAGAWNREYDYAETYHQARFTASAIEALIQEFKADRGATRKDSQAYLRNYFAGDRSAELSLFWPQYVCAIGNTSVKGYATCVCSGAKQ